jgi:hypothetical protein
MLLRRHAARAKNLAWIAIQSVSCLEETLGRLGRTNQILESEFVDIHKLERLVPVPVGLRLLHKLASLHFDRNVVLMMAMAL